MGKPIYLGREYLADPRIFNDKILRQAIVPAANGHFSARSLAKFYAVLANGGELNGTNMASVQKLSRHLDTAMMN